MDSSLCALLTPLLWRGAGGEVAGGEVVNYTYIRLYYSQIRYNRMNLNTTKRFPFNFDEMEQIMEHLQHDREKLTEWALFYAPYQMIEPCRKRSMSRHFFETYGKVIAGPCGCSHFIHDHKRITVPKEIKKELIYELAGFYRKGLLPETNINQFSYLVTAGLDLGVKQESLAAMIRGI